MSGFVEHWADGDYWSPQFLNFFIGTLQFVNVYDRIYCITVSWRVCEQVVCRRPEHYGITEVSDVKNGIREKYNGFSFELETVRRERIPTPKLYRLYKSNNNMSDKSIEYHNWHAKNGRTVMKKTHSNITCQYYYTLNLLYLINITRYIVMFCRTVSY